jgi:Rieske 2Fe-2S family protein
MATFVKTTMAYRPGARTLAGRYYTSAELAAEENERVFARNWICAGREESVRAPGDYMLATVAGESLIIVRDREGELHAFSPVPFSVRTMRGRTVSTAGSLAHRT